MKAYKYCGNLFEICHFFVIILLGEIMKFFGNTWDRLLESEFEKDYFKKLIEKVDNEYNKYKVYPPREKVFSALKLTDFKDVKVVIIGQDPYFSHGQAHGVCFSVLPGVTIPPSLKNIFKEIVSDVGGYVPDNGYLIPWAKQGVLLLNTVLTVREGQPNSHKKFGWEIFTDEIIKTLNKSKRPIVFLLWGANAKQKTTLLDDSKHFILTAPHPSPLSATNGFFGCKHFSQTNKILRDLGQKEIDWQIANIKQTFV